MPGFFHMEREGEGGTRRRQLFDNLFLSGGWNPLPKLPNRGPACFLLQFPSPSGANAALVTVPVFKTGGTLHSAFGGFDSHPLPLLRLLLELELQFDVLRRQRFAVNLNVRIDEII